MIYLIASLIGILTMPFLAAFISFITWENAFKVMGWKYILRASILMGVIVPLITALPGGAS